MKAGPAALLMGEHPSFTPERCINRKQRRVVCTRCSDLCPVGVFSLKSGENPLDPIFKILDVLRETAAQEKESKKA